MHEVTPPDEVPTNEEDPLQDGPPQNGLPAPPGDNSGGNAGLPPAAQSDGGTVGGGGGAAQVGKFASEEELMHLIMQAENGLQSSLHQLDNRATGATDAQYQATAACYHVGLRFATVHMCASLD